MFYPFVSYLFSMDRQPVWQFKLHYMYSQFRRHFYTQSVLTHSWFNIIRYILIHHKLYEINVWNAFDKFRLIYQTGDGRLQRNDVSLQLLFNVLFFEASNIARISIQFSKTFIVSNLFPAHTGWVNKTFRRILHVRPKRVTPNGHPFPFATPL